MNKKTRLHRFEYARQGLLRITRLFAEEAETCAGMERPGADEVHQVRVCCKRQRALLRLLLASEEKPVCESQIKKIAASARKLSSTRDQDVVRETLREMAAKKKKGRSLRPFAYLLEKNEKTVSELEDEVVVENLRQAAKSLREATDVVRNAPLAAHGWSLLALGLERSHRKAREAYAVARAAPLENNLHELRKRMKDLLYQLEIISPWWPDNLKVMRRQLANVAEHLGTINDLAVVERVLPEVAGNDSAQVLVPDAQSVLRKMTLRKTAKALRLAGSFLRAETANWLERLERTRWRRARIDSPAEAKTTIPTVKVRVLSPRRSRRASTTAPNPAGNAVA